MRPLFSIVMPSYLGEYRNAAKQREQKILRAINSVLAQTETRWELIVVADGCDRTVELILKHYTDPRITCIRIDKLPTWDPGVRNTGIRNAEGEWIAYLDTDDYWGERHLESIASDVKDTNATWVWQHILRYSEKEKAFTEFIANIDNCYELMTGNVVHRNIDGLLWPATKFIRATGAYDYATQDCTFIDHLKTIHAPVKIRTGQYCLAHVPGKYDV